MSNWLTQFEVLYSLLESQSGKPKSIMMIPRSKAALRAITILFLVGVSLAPAQVTLVATDASGVSSFANAGHWSDGAAPSGTKDYVDAIGIMRTPDATGASFTFAGNSLTLGNGTTSGVTLAIKAQTAGAVINVASLYLNFGMVSESGTSLSDTLTGGVTLLAGGGIFDAATRTLAVGSAIGGSGGLTAQSTGGAGTVQLTHAGNTYSGGTSVLSGTLDVRQDGALGSGNVSVASGATLKLELGSASDYIADSASLLLSGSAAVNLNFTGSDTIGALSLDGGATYAILGTWGGLSSSAQNKSSLFTGTGVFTVTAVPEGSVAFLFLSGLGMLGLGAIYKRQRLA